MALPKEFQFNLPTKYQDGSAMDPGIAMSLAYEIEVTTMDDPARTDRFLVPPAVVKAAVNGVVTVLFSDIGFVPVIDTFYFAVMYDVTLGTTESVSPDSNSVQFAYGSPIAKPIRPTNLWVT